MDDFEAFRKKKLGKAEAPKDDGASVDEFEAFRKKKLQAKQADAADSMKGMYTFEVTEEGKAKGLVSHRAAKKNILSDEVPEVKGFDSHIKRANVDPESIEKFQSKGLWCDGKPKVDPNNVPKANITSHRKTAEKVDPDSIDTPSGLKRF